MNGKRVAQLLASEVTGHEGRGLGVLAVRDANRDAEPSPDGTRAYRVCEGEREVATVDIYPAYAAVTFVDGEGGPDAARESGLTVEGRTVRLPDGPSVKRVLPALAEG